MKENEKPIGLRCARTRELLIGYRSRWIDSSAAAYFSRLSWEEGREGRKRRRMRHAYPVYGTNLEHHHKLQINQAGFSQHRYGVSKRNYR